MPDVYLYPATNEVRLRDPTQPGSTGITANLSVTEADDTLTASGTVPSSGINATLSITEANDTLLSSGAVVVAASLNITEAGDVLTANGTGTSTSGHRATLSCFNLGLS